MATVKVSFPATATAITCTITSLASSGTAGRASTAVDNTTNLDDDALVMLAINYPNSVPANDKAIYVYAYGSYDGSTYPEGVTGSDAAYTFQGAAGALLTAHRLIGVIPAVQNVSANYGPFAVSPAFGGILPSKWGIIVLNYSGQTLGASATSAAFTRVQFTIA